jgi:hypothetical protein
MNIFISGAFSTTVFNNQILSLPEKKIIIRGGNYYTGMHVQISIC